MPCESGSSSATLPEGCNLCDLGLDPCRVRRITLMRSEYASQLFRVEYAENSFVLKWFKDPSRSTEGRCYDLLRALGVPTLPVCGRTDQSLLLEDLATSAHRRLAEETDVERPETGFSVARWYLSLHEAGRKLLRAPNTAPQFLHREIDLLQPAGVLAIGRALGLESHPVWSFAAEHIDRLKEAMLSMPETLNYNDFHWSNLALSRAPASRLEAIVFDYHLLGIGLAYSDCRNATGSLGKNARAAFWETYGTTDLREAALDAPAATLVTLHEALRRPVLPDWAWASVRRAESGELERDFRLALEICG